MVNEGGTGVRARIPGMDVCGKTGSAQTVSNEYAKSHGNIKDNAWFVGFAPYGPARRRIAFAIVIEHAGYGGRTAATVAGEIVTAAGLSGLLE